MNPQDDDMDDDMMPDDGDDMMPSDSASQEALANVIDLVANNSRQDAYGEYTSGWWRSQGIADSPQAAVTGTYDGGAWANVIISHDDNGQLHHNVGIFRMYPRQEAGPWGPARPIHKYHTRIQRICEGVTRSVRPLSDHGLGSEWQPTELEADYDNGGSLTVFVATDAQPGEVTWDPFADATRGDDNIVLSEAPLVRADEDFMVAWIGNGDTIGGFLDGTAGTFSCANAEGCVFVNDYWGCKLLYQFVRCNVCAGRRIAAGCGAGKC